MNKNTIGDLYYKVFKSGNPMFLYIGICVLLFLCIGLINVFTYLLNVPLNLNLFVRNYLGLPALLSAIPAKFYTIFTYMFFHDGLMHVLFNMLWLFWFGQIFLNFLKPKQFHVVFLGGGLFGALFYILGLNIFPVFSNSISGANVIGASAAVMAIITATATLIPNYSVQLLLLGNVRIKYLAIAFFVFDVLSMASTNAGGSFTHIGGAFFGFMYIKQMQKSNDWANLFKFKPKSKLKVVKNDAPFNKSTVKHNSSVSQEEIDAILDKISSSGYEKLTTSEKEKLFKASKN